MKILIDIGHPAHVHYFRNLIKLMERKGHQFFVIAKDRNVTYNLLDSYNIPYVKRRNYPKSLLGKLLQIPFTDLIVLYYAIKFKPDILLGFSGTHIAHTGMLLNKPSIVIDDTEHASFAHASYKPFAKHIITPKCFKKDFGKKQIRFDGYMELCYLHPNYFTPDPNIKKELGIEGDEKYVILRFVSWSANHDLGHTGINIEMKRRAVKEFSKYAKVFISSENELPEDIDHYRIKLSPEKMHSALAGCSLLYGESATMASECAILGVPSIFLDNSGRGYTEEEEEKYNLVSNFTESLQDQRISIQKGIEILRLSDKNLPYKQYQQQLLDDKIDVTAFFMWFIENYPESNKIMEENPNYQYNIKESTH